MKKIGSVLKAVSKGFSVISFLGLFVGVIFVVVDVVLRYFFDSPIHGDYDITQLWLSVIVFAALAYVQTERGHIGVTMVLKVLPEKLGVALYGDGAHPHRAQRGQPSQPRRTGHRPRAGLCAAAHDGGLLPNGRLSARKNSGLFRSEPPRGVRKLRQLPQRIPR